jgi:uncharacterized protein
MTIANNSVEVILASATAALSAQLFKCLWYTARKKPVNFRTLVQTGGMPSSHSSSMVAMATSVGLIEGFDSTIFAVALGISMVVMYDAAGLRQAAGKMAGILNKLTEDLYMEHPDRVPTRLRELLGHTPVEVIVGAFLGVATAYAYHTRLTLG